MDKEVKPLENKEVADMRKKAGVPEIDPDALPSSYASKMTACATKHVKKLADMIKSFDAIPSEDITPIQTRNPVLHNVYRTAIPKVASMIGPNPCSSNNSTHFWGSDSYDPPPQSPG